MRGGSGYVRDQRARIGLCSGWTRWMSGGNLPFVVRGGCVLGSNERKWRLRRSGRRRIGSVDEERARLGLCGDSRRWMFTFGCKGTGWFAFQRERQWLRRSDR